MKICYNVSAMIANNALTKNDDRLARSLQRLSSGLKVVEAKDNPAGMAMGKRMNAQIKGIAVASQNSSDAISVIETADGALSEIHDILQRMNELAVKSSNGIWSDTDRSMMEEEVAQLKNEIKRIANDTQFNGENLLDGNFDLKGYTNNDNVKVGYYSDQVTTGVYGINSLTITLDADGNIDPAIVGTPVAGMAVGGNVDLALPADAKVSGVNCNILKITSDQNADFEINLKFATAGTFNNLEVDITGIGAMTMQTGSNEGQVLDIRIPSMSLEEMGIRDMNLKTRESSEEAIESVKGAIEYVSSARSRLGAYQNRLDHSINNLDVTSENMTAAYSRIMDVDMAEEMTEYTTVQVISQASMSMLAQANERPAQVLQLLQ